MEGCLATEQCDSLTTKQCNCLTTEHITLPTLETGSSPQQESIKEEEREGSCKDENDEMIENGSMNDDGGEANMRMMKMTTEMMDENFFKKWIQ